MPMLLITISMISYHLLLSLENLNDEERKWSTCDGESTCLTCLWQHLRWSFWLRTFIGTSLPCLDGPSPVHHVDVDDPELLGEGREGRRQPPEDEFIVMDVLIFCLVLHGRKSTSSFPEQFTLEYIFSFGFGFFFGINLFFCLSAILPTRLRRPCVLL